MLKVICVSKKAVANKCKKTKDWRFQKLSGTFYALMPSSKTKLLICGDVKVMQPWCSLFIATCYLSTSFDCINTSEVWVVLFQFIFCLDNSTFDPMETSCWLFVEGN